MKYAQRCLVCVGFAVGLMMGLIGEPAIAQPKQSTIRPGLPGRRISSGTRCRCIPGQVVVLSPANYLSLTASDRPSLYFVLSEFENRYPVEFVLQDTQGKTLYKQSLNADEMEKLISIQLPESFLQVGHDYRWSFSVIHEDEHHKHDIGVAGWIRRVSVEGIAQNSLEIEREFNWPTTLMLAKEYQDLGIWTDAISLLAKSSQQHPDVVEVQQAWLQLLQDLNLETYLLP